MSYAARTAALRSSPSGGVADQFNDGHTAYGMQSYAAYPDTSAFLKKYSGTKASGAIGHSMPLALTDILGSDGLWYTAPVRASGQVAGDTPDAPDASGPSTAAVIGDALHQTAGVVTDIINQGSQTQRQQLHDAALVRIAEINAAAGQGSQETQAANAAALQALQAAVAATSAAMARQQAPAPERSLNTNFMIGAAVVGVVVLGGIAFMMSSRKNPSCGPNCNCEKCRPNPVIGSGRSRHFIPQHELDRRARKRARRRAA